MKFSVIPLWDEIFAELTQKYSEIETDKVLVDAATARMVLNPGSLDVIVASNLHGDILSDLAAALAGSLGIAASGNLDPNLRQGVCRVLLGTADLNVVHDAICLK